MLDEMLNEENFSTADFRFFGKTAFNRLYQAYTNVCRLYEEAKTHSGCLLSDICIEQINEIGWQIDDITHNDDGDTLIILTYKCYAGNQNTYYLSINLNGNEWDGFSYECYDFDTDKDYYIDCMADQCLLYCLKEMDCPSKQMEDDNYTPEELIELDEMFNELKKYLSEVIFL